MTYRGTGALGGTKDQRFEEASRNLLEQENNRKLEELGAQVNLLKDVWLH
jgi:hypothetical protein